MDTGSVLATVAFEADATFLTPQRPAASFGRAAECVVQFGHQPVVDLGAPRVAGTIRMVDERVGVDNLSDRIAFDVKAPDGPLETVRPGALLAPPNARFEIIYRGAEGTYRILVHRQAEPRPLVDRTPGATTDEPATRADPDLTSRQWAMLDAYTEPLRNGSTVPATHREVARKLNWSYATMRLECHAIWAAFKVAGVPMREFPDKRDAVIDAAVRHQLRAPPPE